MPKTPRKPRAHTRYTARHIGRPARNNISRNRFPACLHSTPCMSLFSGVGYAPEVVMSDNTDLEPYPDCGSTLDILNDLRCGGFEANVVPIYHHACPTCRAIILILVTSNTLQLTVDALRHALVLPPLYPEDMEWSIDDLGPTRCEALSLSTAHSEDMEWS